MFLFFHSEKADDTARNHSISLYFSPFGIRGNMLSTIQNCLAHKVFGWAMFIANKHSRKRRPFGVGVNIVRSQEHHKALVVTKFIGANLGKRSAQSTVGEPNATVFGLRVFILEHRPFQKHTIRSRTWSIMLSDERVALFPYQTRKPAAA